MWLIYLYFIVVFQENESTEPNTQFLGAKIPWTNLRLITFSCLIIQAAENLSCISLTVNLSLHQNVLPQDIIHLVKGKVHVSSTELPNFKRWISCRILPIEWHCITLLLLMCLSRCAPFFPKIFLFYQNLLVFCQVSKLWSHCMIILILYPATFALGRTLECPALS